MIIDQHVWHMSGFYTKWQKAVDSRFSVATTVVSKSQTTDPDRVMLVKEIQNTFNGWDRLKVISKPIWWWKRSLHK
ncbi:MAG: hypothetical protein IPN18_05105 [Ignavibacteriales bacterium]|nr:hypothetical protein [Ignavibacteriales bacterium]